MYEFLTLVACRGQIYAHTPLYLDPGRGSNLLLGI